MISPRLSHRPAQPEGKTGSNAALLSRPKRGTSERTFDRTDETRADGSRASALGHRFGQVASSGPKPPRNRTGLPDRLKAGIEQLSGMSMDHVKVHYNSSRPAQLNALAFAQGRNIHVAPGQERHLPHEAWHVVQQAQGRVRPTMQMKGGLSVNDDTGLEREADVMGAKSRQMPRSDQRETRSTTQDFASSPHPQVLQSMTAVPVIQMVKYIRKKNGQIVQVEDGYNKKKDERWSDEDAFLNDHRGGDAAEENRKKIREERAAAARTQERAARRARVTPANMPQPHAGKQVHFPGVVGRGDNAPADLVYRGMSVNNVRNMQKGKPAIFTAQNPGGKASAIDHIVKDDPDSPYLSFEAGGLGISAGKYAAKPVAPDTHKPFGVEKMKGGFLKQEKSYVSKSRKDYPKAKRIGYVGGISKNAGMDRLDVSDKAKAEAAFNPPAHYSDNPRSKAAALAVADREVLVKPGKEGIGRQHMPLVAKVQEVTEAYYRKHLARQTSRKALGYYKRFESDPVYSKIQIPNQEGNNGYKFAIPKDLRRAGDDSEDEMSDIESVNLGDYESDEDGEKEEKEEKEEKREKKNEEKGKVTVSPSRQSAVPK